jgi:YggT family protein
MASIVNVVNSLINFYEILVLVWCILSWIPMRSGILAEIQEVISKIVMPYLGLFRRFIPPLGGIDFSPVVAILLLNVIQRLLVSILLAV